MHFCNILHTVLLPEVSELERSQRCLHSLRLVRTEVMRKQVASSLSSHFWATAIASPERCASAGELPSQPVTRHMVGACVRVRRRRRNRALGCPGNRFHRSSASCQALHRPDNAWQFHCVAGDALVQIPMDRRCDRASCGLNQLLSNEGKYRKSHRVLTAATAAFPVRSCLDVRQRSIGALPAAARAHEGGGHGHGPGVYPLPTA